MRGQVLGGHLGKCPKENFTLTHRRTDMKTKRSLLKKWHIFYINYSVILAKYLMVSKVKSPLLIVKKFAAYIEIIIDGYLKETKLAFSILKCQCMYKMWSTWFLLGLRQVFYWKVGKGLGIWDIMQDLHRVELLQNRDRKALIKGS